MNKAHKFLRNILRIYEPYSYLQNGKDKQSPSINTRDKTCVLISS